MIALAKKRRKYLELLTANLSGAIRSEKLHGREYLVAPLSMINPGVLAGSRGPLYYPLDEVSKNYQAWNHVPLVLDHPTINGTPVSARSPAVLEKYSLGFVFNAKVSGKLRAEGWFDVERVNKIAPEIITNLRQGKPIELSTGLWTDNIPAPQGSNHNGTPYTHVARNYRPDHLAILVNKKGACSVKDGCGVLVNSEGEARGQNGRWMIKESKPYKKARIKEELGSFESQEVASKFADTSNQIHRSSGTGVKHKAVWVANGGPGSGPHAGATHLSKVAEQASHKADRFNYSGDHAEASDLHKEAAAAHSKIGNQSQADLHDRKAMYHHKAAKQISAGWQGSTLKEYNPSLNERYSLLVGNKWSEEAREAAIAARRQHAHTAGQKTNVAMASSQRANLQGSITGHRQAQHDHMEASIAHTLHAQTLGVGTKKGQKHLEAAQQHEAMANHHDSKTSSTIGKIGRGLAGAAIGATGAIGGELAGGAIGALSSFGLAAPAGAIAGGMAGHHIASKLAGHLLGREGELGAHVGGLAGGIGAFRHAGTSIAGKAATAVGKTKLGAKVAATASKTAAGVRKSGTVSSMVDKFRAPAKLRATQAAVGKSRAAMSKMGPAMSKLKDSKTAFATKMATGKANKAKGAVSSLKAGAKKVAGKLQTPAEVAFAGVGSKEAIDKYKGPKLKAKAPKVGKKPTRNESMDYRLELLTNKRKPAAEKAHFEGQKAEAYSKVAKETGNMDAHNEACKAHIKAAKMFRDAGNNMRANQHEVKAHGHTIQIQQAYRSSDKEAQKKINEELASKHGVKAPKKSPSSLPKPAPTKREASSGNDTAKLAGAIAAGIVGGHVGAHVAKKYTRNERAEALLGNVGTSEGAKKGWLKRQHGGGSSSSSAGSSVASHPVEEPVNHDPFKALEELRKSVASLKKSTVSPALEIAGTHIAEPAPPEVPQPKAKSKAKKIKGAKTFEHPYLTQAQWKHIAKYDKKSQGSDRSPFPMDHPRQERSTSESFQKEAISSAAFEASDRSHRHDGVFTQGEAAALHAKALAHHTYQASAHARQAKLHAKALAQHSAKTGSHLVSKVATVADLYSRVTGNSSMDATNRLQLLLQD